MMAPVEVRAEQRDTNEYTSAKDKYGHDLTDTEILRKIDEDWLLDNNFHLSLVDPDTQEWLAWRHPENDRGDESTEMKRKASVESIGIVPGIRKGAWIMKQGSNSKRHWLLHFASLCGGLRRAWVEDRNKENHMVQHSVAAGIEGCKLYDHKMPAYCCRFLKDLGNKLNDEATSTTFLEVYRSTKDVDPGWNRRKRLFGWTNQSLGNAKYDEKKFEYIDLIFENRWPHYRNFELCAAFHRDSQKTTITNKDGSSGPLLWDALVERAQRECDFTHADAKKHSIIFANLHNIVQGFKSSSLECHSYLMLDVIMMTLPKLGTAMGVCSLAPDGLGAHPLHKITEEQVERLAVVMIDSPAQHLRSKFREQQLREKAAAQAKEQQEIAKQTRGGKKAAKAKAMPPLDVNRIMIMILSCCTVSISLYDTHSCNVHVIELVFFFLST